MKRLHVLVGVFIVISIGVVELSADDAWQISTRSAPLPAGASEQLRASIGAVPKPDVAARKAVFPKTPDQWRATIQQNAAQRGTSLEALGQQLAVKIKPDNIEGVAVYHVVPNSIDPIHKSHLFIYVHGGAYVFGGGEASVGEAAIIASTAKIPTLSIDYRMPPEHPFPAAVDDVVSVYQELLKKRAPSSMAIGGTSAGGGLSLASVHKFKSLDLPVPGAIYGGTPWADLTKTGDSLFTNEGLDRVLVTYDGMLGAAAELYAAGRDLKDPLLSPVYGDFRGFPPTYLVTGTRDMFLSDTARTHRKLHGATADLNVYEGMSHAGYALVVTSPESQTVYRELSEFLKQHLQ